MKYIFSLNLCIWLFYFTISILINFILSTKEKLKNSNHVKVNTEISIGNKLKNKKYEMNSSFFSSSASESRTKLKSLFSLNLKSLSEIKKVKSENRFQGFPRATVNLNNTAEIGPGPTYFVGWAKYFILKNTKSFEMKEFFVNGAFYKEQSQNFMNEHRSETMNFIPNENNFYLILTDEYLNIVSSKFHDLLTTIDILELKDLYDVEIADDNTFKGGVEDLGNFREGFCILLKGSNATGKFKWVICTNTANEKFQLIKRIVILRIRCQLKTGTLKTNKNSIMTNKLQFNIGELGIRNENNSTSCNESKWIELQDWSSCTLACGGGTQTLHRYCLRGPNSPPCTGENIVVRPCNTQPCTNVTDEVISGEILPIQVKVIPVSLRPRVFRRCLVKEEDMNIVREDLGNLRTKPRIPSRVVLNNRTITIFESGSYDSILSSFYISDLIFREWEDDSSCIKLRDHSKSLIMCVMCSSQDKEKEVKNWILDIIEFRDKCKPKIKPTGEDPRITRYKRELEIQDIVRTMRETKKDDEEKKKVDEIKTIKMAQILAMKALEKEREFEKRLEREQHMKEEREDEELQNQYECEERKKANLLRALMEKKAAETKTETEEKLQEIQKDLKLKIILQRRKLLRRLNLIKLAHQRKRNQLKQHIMDTRRVLTQNILTAERTGDMQNCINRIGNESGIQKYCTVAYSNDPESEVECKNEENFCYLCCENEFGEMHREERDQCIKKCEKKHEINCDGKIEETYKTLNLTTIEISVNPNKYKNFINY